MVFIVATLCTHTAAAFSDDVPDDPIATSHLPIALRARDRAMQFFNDGSDPKEKSRDRYKWAGRPTVVLKYERPLQLMQRDMVFEVKVPGNDGAWARFRLKF